MKINLDCLPQGLDNASCNVFIANAPLDTWRPVLDRLQHECRLRPGTWTKLPQGSNALFGLGDELIVKLVPPNWRRQGDKEILVAPLLEGKLSLKTPSLIASGEVDNWVFVVSSRLKGVLLADIWPTLATAEKHSMMVQTGQVLRELGDVRFDDDIAIKVDWPAYLDGLISGCVARHQRRYMPAGLLAQVLPFIESAGDFARREALRFIHMDVHPWNLMATREAGNWRLDGLLDFGDAIVGNCDRFELLTPAMFMAQGDPVLLRAMLDSYGAVGDVSAGELQRQLTACMLIRPDSDVMFCMRQVPVSGPRDTWEQIGTQMFPI